MAELRTKLKKKNTSAASADVVYVASSSDIVDRPGKNETVEQSLEAIEESLPLKVGGIYTIYDATSKIPTTPSDTNPQTIIGSMQDHTIAILAIAGQPNTTYWPAKNGTFFAIRISQEFAIAFFQEVGKNSLYTAVYYKSVSTSQVTWTGWRDYNIVLEYDSVPTNGSSKLLTSGVIYTALEDIRSDFGSADANLNSTITSVLESLNAHTGDTSVHVSSSEKSTWNNKQDKLTLDSTPTSGSDNPITSGGTYTALQGYSKTTHNHDSTYVKSSTVGANGGIVPLDSSGKIAAQYLPSYVDDVVEGTYVNTTTFNGTDGSAVTPESGKIYVDISSNITYRWTGSIFTEISKSLALGETSSTAYRGDRGKIAYDHSQTAISRSNTTATQVLSNGGTFTAISEVRDSSGHVTGTTAKTYTLPTITSGIDMIVRSSQPGASEQSEGDLWAESLS